MESDIHVLLLVLNFQVWFSVNRTLHYSCQVKTLWSWTDLWGCCKVGFVSVIKGPWGLREFWCLQKKRIIKVGKFSSKKYSFGGEILIFFSYVLPIFSRHLQIQFSENGGFYSWWNFLTKCSKKYFRNISTKIQEVFISFWGRAFWPGLEDLKKNTYVYL